MATQIEATLQALAALPSTNSPFISIYLDWTTDSTGKRQALVVLDQELNQHTKALQEHADNQASFESDRARITAYVQEEAPKDALGLAIFACAAEGIWTTLPLHVPVETQIVVDRYPQLFQLARLIDDYETYAVVVAEGQEARIYVFAPGQILEAGATAADEPIRRADAGGWSQRRFERHVNFTISAHMRDLATELGKVIDEHDVQHVVIAGNDAIKGAIRAALSDQITAKLVEFTTLDPTSDLRTIKDAIEPLIQQVESEQEAQVLARLEDQLASKGGLATVGVSEVAMALSKGQVQTLVLLRDFNGVGGICPNCGTIRPGQRDKCPYDGAELERVELREAFARQVIQQSGELHTVQQSNELAKHGGVGALLRYRDDIQTSEV